MNDFHIESTETNVSSNLERCRITLRDEVAIAVLVAARRGWTKWATSHD